MKAEALLGTVLGNCTIQQLIGQGGMGAVYLAQQERPRRQVAVKVLMPASPLKPHQLSAFLERFRRETDAAASLEHPHIMPVYEYGERGGLAYLVMPYISAGTLRDVMEREGQMSFESAANYTEQMAAALDFAHSRGVIHRDIKPANMLLTSDNRLLLTDFGLVKVVATDHHSAQIQLTGAGAPVGTPDYMSPEQVIGAEVNGRADQYSLGVVLFQMVTGTTPFQGETPMQIASQQLHMQPPTPRSLRPDLPEAAERVLLRAMAKRPDERFNSVQEFATAFRAALVEQPRVNSLSISANRGGLLSNTNLRQGNLLDAQWQASGMMPAASAQPTATDRPAGAGLLSKTGMFPRVGLSGNTGAMAAAPTAQAGLFASNQMTVETGKQQAFPDASMTVPMQPAGLQSSLFASNTGTLQQPFPPDDLQQMSPATQNTTSALALLNAEQQDNNTIKLTGAVKVVQVPVGGGQYVTGLLPVQKEVPDPISEPPTKKRLGKIQRIVLTVMLLALIIGGVGGGLALRNAHGNSPSTANNDTGNPTATAMAQATATAQANILFSDSLMQNTHNWSQGSIKGGGGQYAFTKGAYHITNQGNNSIISLTQQDFTETTLSYQITMDEVAGNDSYPANTIGVILDYHQTTANNKQVATFYTFEIRNETGNFEYDFYKYDSTQAKPWGDKAIWTATPGKEFHGGHGPNAFNVLKVVDANGSFTFYVNGQKVGTAKDTSLQPGRLGMLVNYKGTEVAFSNMLVTRNP
jgi:serine/threonine protein kinase